LQQVYQNMPWVRDILQVATIWRNTIREIAYGILVLMGRLLDMCNGAINTILNINIMQIGPIQDLANSMSPITWSVLTIAITFAFVYMIIYGGKNKELFRNLILSIVFIVAIPLMFSQLNTIKNAGVLDMENLISNGTSPGESILQSSVVVVANSTKGIVTLNQKGSGDLPAITAFGVSGINPYYLDINAVIGDTAPWQYKITSVVGDDQNGYTLYGETLGMGVFGMGKEQLYAFSFSFWGPFLTMLVTIVAMIFSIFKVSRTIYDLAFHQVIAPIVFASDVNSGTRSKKFIQSLIGSYIMIVLVLVVLKIFLDISSWADLNISNMFIRLGLLAGAAWGTIDGPDIVVKLLGIDAGVRSATNMLLGMNAAAGMARGAAGLVNGAVHTVTGAANTVGNVVGGISELPHMANKFEEGAKEAMSGTFGSFGEYSNSLAQKSQGLNGISEGKSAISNMASKAGYLHEHLFGDKSPLEQAQSGTGGKPSESAESVVGNSQTSTQQPVTPESSHSSGNPPESPKYQGDIQTQPEPQSNDMSASAFSAADMPASPIMETPLSMSETDRTPFAPVEPFTSEPEHHTYTPEPENRTYSPSSQNTNTATLEKPSVTHEETLWPTKRNRNKEDL